MPGPPVSSRSRRRNLEGRRRRRRPRRRAPATASWACPPRPPAPSCKAQQVRRGAGGGVGSHGLPPLAMKPAAGRHAAQACQQSQLPRRPALLPAAPRSVQHPGHRLSHPAGSPLLGLGGAGGAQRDVPDVLCKLGALEVAEPALAQLLHSARSRSVDALQVRPGGSQARRRAATDAWQPTRTAFFHPHRQRIHCAVALWPATPLAPGRTSARTSITLPVCTPTSSHTCAPQWKASVGSVGSVGSTSKCSGRHPLPCCPPRAAPSHPPASPWLAGPGP